MAVRRGISRAMWQREQRRFCRAGRQFAKLFDTAGAAYRACTNGAFIAFWLESRGVDSVELKHLVPGGWWYLTGGGPDFGQPATLEQLAEYANILRARFNVDGTRRKVRA